LTNADNAVVEAFGQEWSKFDQSDADPVELRAIFDLYFGIFPWERLPRDPVGFDLGCGSGRWAFFVAPRVGKLFCIDASASALQVAQKKLASYDNCEFRCASVESIPLPDKSADFGYSLGVLHHLPDPDAGIEACVRKLKLGAPFLVYLYYAFDNRPWWFRAIWRISDMFRHLISRLPFAIKSRVCDVIAAVVYWPLARTARLLEKIGLPVDAVPLAPYRNRSFYIMRNDALDRFGTRLERRFTRAQIEVLMRNAGLENVRFSEMPCWCAIGYKALEA
jgi:SAM-dependent methyltransferase